jgi:energy-coupling factor transporter ATP-binding protein EcfA2
MWYHQIPDMNRRTPRRKTDLGATRAIAKLKVDGLFGQFDYEFPPPGAQGSLPLDVFVLYGDNGSGKTTLLNLIFHTLSPANNRGHRSAIQKIPFKRFELVLGDGSKIAISRDSEPIGGYWAYAEKPGGAAVQTNFSIQREGRFASDEHEREFISFLKRVGRSVYFVSADRRTSSDELPAVDSRAAWEAGNLVVSPEGLEYADLPDPHPDLRRRLAQDRPETLRGPSLVQAMELARDWITQRVLRAASRGTRSTHGIYSQVVKDIATSTRTPGDSPGQALVDGLTSTLESLSARSKAYARFGFATELDVQEMIEVIRGARDVALIARVLQPYVESTNASFDELAGVYKITSLLIDRFAEFYTGKTASFQVRQGFAVRGSRDNKPIDPAWLSSGEQQLLLLFCYALVCSDRNSIFIVDEPELSLNVKWQRRLIQSLLDIVAGGRVQFVLASHSIELVAEHLDKVLKLQPPVGSPLAPSEVETRVGPPHNS